MTTPVAPTTDPVPTTAPAQPVKADAPTTPAPDETPEQKIERLEAAVKAANSEAAKARTTAKQNAADEARKELAQQIGKALGLVADDTADPAKLTEQVGSLTAETKAAKLELAVFRAAATAGADATALLDSRTFLAKLAEVDPADSTAIATAISEAVDTNPAFGSPTPTTPRTPAPNRAQGTSGSPAVSDPAQQFASILQGHLK